MTFTDAASHKPPPRYWPLGQLVLARMREFYREPEVLFWVYGFPILTVLALGVAFRNRAVEEIHVDIVNTRPGAAAVEATLREAPHFVVVRGTLDDLRRRLQTGKSALAIIPGDTPNDAVEYWYDPARPESVLARSAVHDALERAAGRVDRTTATDRAFDEPGGRYVDFLVPGLLGMSLMGGGLWGVGFVTVDMRIRKLLKRFLATPMRRGDFLAGIMISRMAFLIPEVLILLVFSRIFFGVEVHGSLATMALLILLGSVTFSGIGLLVASRAKTIEAVSGLMNLVMLPMWVLSGIFFSSDRFPQMAQPFIKSLPLTLLIDALRAVSLEGATLAAIWPQVAGLAVWAGVSFALALKLFRWM